MRKKIAFTLLGCLCLGFLLFGGVGLHNASAVSMSSNNTSLVTGIYWVGVWWDCYYGTAGMEGVPQNPYDTAQFELGISWGSDCYRNGRVICENVGMHYYDGVPLFECQQTPLLCPYLERLEGSSISVSYAGFSDPYEYYELYITAPSEVQDIKGQFRRLRAATLTAVPVTTDGSAVPGLSSKSSTVNYGENATVWKDDKAGYTFKGWRSDRYSGTPSGGNSYTAYGMGYDATIYAVYERQQRTLSGVAINTAGASVAGVVGNPNSSTVWYGDSASITRKTHSCYDFKGWKNNVSDTSYTGGTGATYSVGSLTSNLTRYAVYQIKSMTLTGKAVDTSGKSLASVMSDVTSTVNCGSSATITRRTADGYTFKGWRTSASSGTPSGGTTYTANPLNNSTTVYAVYERNSFTGQARVYNGNNSSGTPSKSTGYVKADTSVSQDVDCANAGCNVSYYLDLKTNSGSGSTTYTAYRGNNAISGHTLRSYAPSTSGTNMYAKTETLKPGGSLCYSIYFKPYGSLANNAYKTAKACATAKITYFKGRSSVSGGASGDTGWVNTNTSKTVNINNCSATSGCKATFKHELQRSNSIGSTTYAISRTSNLVTSTRAIAANNNVKTGTFNSSSAAVSTNGAFTLYPGMVVCEKMLFKPNNDSTKTVSNVSTTICASALGNAQPNDPSNPDTPENPSTASGDTSFINIKVRNQNVSKYSNYQRTVYAKPKDKLTFRATYNPVLQYTYHLKPQQMRINSGTIYNGGGSTLGSLYNSKKGSSLKNWNNAFSVQLAYNNNFGSATLVKNATYTIGDLTKRTDTNNYNAATGVLTSDVGKTIDEKAITNLNSTTQTTPSQVTFTNNGGNNLGNVITTAKSKVATAKVPYNYDTGIEIKTDPSVPVYAGEEASFTYTVTLRPKKNNETMNSSDKNYATNVGNPKYKLIVYRGSEKGGSSGYGSDNLCGYFGLSNDQVNCGYSSEGNSLFKNNIYTETNLPKDVSSTVYIQDMPAGSQICVAAAFWPSNSGADTNLDKNGSKTWRISNSKCYKIAKKPSLQIWGGNFYSSGNINTAVAVKNHVLGFTNYNVATSNGSSYIFGSWGELGIASPASIQGTASGAYTGYTSNNNGALVASPGGSQEARGKISFCNRSVLTFANSPCSSAGGKTGDLGNTNSIAGADKDKSAIVANFAVSKRDAEGRDLNLVSGEVALNAEDKKNDVGTYYYHNDSDNLTIPTSTINAGALQLVASGKSILINGNITNNTETPYTTIEGMPKLIIYAKDNIYINCDVDRIDAILIADGTVITCADQGFGTDLSTNSIKAKINQPQNSKQLTINGTVIADRLIVNRTYGAATGDKSIVPAEIINYDGTNYAWSNWTGGETSIDDMNITYTKELSPRY